MANSDTTSVRALLLPLTLPPNINKIKIHQPEFFWVAPVIIVIIIIIIIIISFMQGIYTYIPETNYVPREYSVAAIISIIIIIIIIIIERKCEITKKKLIHYPKIEELKVLTRYILAI